MTSRHVGLVRAVMHGREGVTRQLLLEATAAAGGTDVRTHLTTGNVAFAAEDGAAVCAELGRVLTTVVGRRTPVLHRTASRLAAIVASGPFDDAPDAAELLLVAAEQPLDEALATPMPAGLVLLGHDGADAWFARADRDGPHAMPVLEERTGALVTSRARSTIERLARLEV